MRAGSVSEKRSRYDRIKIIILNIFEILNPRDRGLRFEGLTDLDGIPENSEV